MSTAKFTLSKSHIQDLVSTNTYKTDDFYISRCVDGRYPNSSRLPALAIPGADAGQLAVLYTAANQYGFIIDEDLTLQTLLDVIGGKKNFSFHTDKHNLKEGLGGGCGYLKLLKSDPEAFEIDKFQVENLINKQLAQVVEYGSSETVLEGEHKEGAAIQIEGEYGIMPSFSLEISEGTASVQVFVYHKTFVDRRHRVLAEKLIENKAVVLYDGLDATYLSQVLSETAEMHLYETLKRLAKGLPLYNVHFKDEKDFEITEMGII